MRVKIYSDVEGELIVKRAPSIFHDQVVQRKFEKDNGLFTLLVFPTQKKTNIYSGAVSHALSKVSTTVKMVAFANCFTLESLAILKERGVEIFATDDFPWTDDGLTNIRETIASPVKFPLK
ncbi:MAG: hypothetical protein B7Y56_15870 [Gallionellales bacterium 35-53-114]|jgi:hypothetical protein|nr:MAG: hypothetical protein B7Y56_15870 [Gallionellales bacterium 35-53-114]HQS60023.1 hypothetical protein [Gallionellaceae bacterium]